MTPLVRSAISTVYRRPAITLLRPVIRSLSGIKRRRYALGSSAISFETLPHGPPPHEGTSSAGEQTPNLRDPWDGLGYSRPMRSLAVLLTAVALDLQAPAPKPAPAE